MATTKKPAKKAVVKKQAAKKSPAKKVAAKKVLPKVTIGHKQARGKELRKVTFTFYEKGLELPKGTSIKDLLLIHDLVGFAISKEIEASFGKMNESIGKLGKPFKKVPAKKK